MTQTIKRAKQALWNRYHELNPDIKFNTKGYIETSKYEDYIGACRHNLLQPEWMELILKDYEEGDGNELELKFRAVHSSSALVANHFARFKKDPGQLVILDHSGFNCVDLEKKLPTGLEGIPPNLDVFFENRNVSIALESKLLETLSPEVLSFDPKYDKKDLPYCEPQWLDFIKPASSSPKTYFHIAQLVKHYLGLINYTQGKPNHKPILLYLYWEPVNAQQIKEYQIHRMEVNNFRDRVVGSRVEFISMSYPELWEAWSKETILADHARKLIDRYCVTI